ncbi:MAG: copper chaperone [Bacteroidetes bacterium]|jgi:copper chaperone|nr:copper chaperone [Bacteroidota bacterium]
MNQIQFNTNINCGNCIKSVTPFLNALEELDAWQVNTDVAEKILTVETEISSQEMEQKVIAAVSEAGFKIQPVR